MLSFKLLIRKAFLPLLLCLACHLHSQTRPPAVSFKTPEVSAFNQSIETPVSYFTGVPSISIPIWEITIKDVTIPITLDYQAGGIRVDQEATWVGLGWNLSYGGQISRTIKGKADETGFYTSNSISTFLSLAGIMSDPLMSTRGSYIRDAKNGQRDFMPDEFHYSIAGYSGSFKYDQTTSKFVLFPREDLVINRSSTQNTFELKLPNGVKANYWDKILQGDGATSSVSSWLISKVENAYSDNITFQYDSAYYYQYKLASQNITAYPEGGIGSLQTNIVQVSFYDKRIKKILADGTTIEFNTISRQDMPAPALDEIVVRNRDNVIVKRVRFRYSYFYGDAFNTFTSGIVSNDYKFKRLRLDTVSISGTDNTSGGTYHFDYYTESQMPSKHTYAQDHWGYYNGLSNPTLIPNLDTRFFTGGDRRVKPDKVKVFSLKTITYPTGGKKEFIYEANTAKEGNLPHELKYQYQDDNFIENSAQILVRGESRSSYQPEADYMGTTGQRFYKKLFTVPANGYAYLGNGWHSSTNFGTTPSDISLGLTCQACYAKFTLYRVDDQGNRIFLRDHESVKCNSSGIPQERDGTDDAYVELMPGQYEMELQLLYNASNSGNNNQFHETDFTIKWREFDLTKRMLYVGGLRVKEIKAYSSENTLAQHKKYTYNDPYNSWSATSGQTIILPYYKTPMVKRTYTDLGGASGHYQSYFGFGFYADSRIPLETTSGSYAGYEYVTEETVAAGSSETLKTEYKFSFESPLYSQFYTSKNIGIYEAKEWSRGKLLNKKVFRGNSVIQEERYEYYIASPHLAGDNYEDYAAELNTNLISTIALNPMPWDEEDYVDWISFGPVYDQWGWYYSLDDFTVSSSLFASILPINLVKLNLGPFSTLNSYQARLPYFTKRTGFDKLKKKTTIINGDNNETLTKIENYYYERTPAHFELTKTETLDSKGNTNAITYKYPGDFASSSVIDAMLARRMINSIIEQKSYKAATLLTTQQNNYALWQSNAFVALSSMQSAQRSNALETEITVQEYDTKANLKRLIGRDGVTKSYLWDYNNYYPIAEITNASTTTIAATSFEADGTGGWTYSGSGTVDNTAPTGKMIFNLNGSNPISKTGLNQLTDYTISYWTNKGSAYAITGTRLGYPITGKTVNGWTYYEHRVVGSTSYTISGNGAIDELRFYPLITQMVTYTYEPLVGVKTQCDVNNRILYYEYDDIGRLVLIRDQDKNIVKRICYNYTGEPESCVLQQFTSAAFNANVTPNNCPPGQIASPVSVSVPAAQFTSYISLLDANQQAQAYAQQQANQQAVCFTPMYARIEYVPNWVDEHDAPDWEYYDEIVDVWIRFYTDAACTQPYTLTQNFNVNLFTSGMYEDDSGTSTTSNGFGVTILSGTNGKLLESELPLFGYNYFYDENHDLISLERWSASYLLNLNQASFIGIPPKYNGIVLPPWY